MTNELPPSPDPTNFFAKALAFELGMGLFAVGIGAWFRFNPLAFLQAELHEGTWALAMVWGVAAALPLAAALLILDRHPIGPFRALKELTDSLIMPLFGEQKLWQLLLVSAAAGFGEETLFRGLVQSGLSGTLSPLPALIIASIAFGICHWLSTTYAVVAMLIGLYLGALFMMTESLLAPMVTHGLYDFIALAYFLKWRKRTTAAIE